MLNPETKRLLAWALDCALTERDKVGILKTGQVMKAAKEALQEPEVSEQVCKLVDIFDPLKAQDIRSFLKRHRKG